MRDVEAELGDFGICAHLIVGFEGISPILVLNSPYI